MIKYLITTLIISGFTTFSFSQDNWKEGHYYDIKGRVHYGLIKYKYDFKPSITFKESETAKEQIIKSWKSKGFVVGQDSFTVVKNFKLLRGQDVAHDFAQVIEVGSLILLKNYSRITYGNSPGNYGAPQSDKVETYILTKPNSDKFWVVSSKKKRFNELIGSITKDFPEDSFLKDASNLTYDQVPEIVRKYNSLNN